MKKYKWLIIALVIIIFGLIFIIDKEELFDKKFHLDRNLYNSKTTLKSINKDKLNSLLRKRSSFVLFISPTFCTSSSPCEDTFEDVFKEKKITLYKIDYTDIKDTKLNEKIKYAPSVAIIRKGKLVAFLDANSSDDKKIYDSSKEFIKWLKKYIYLSR